MKIYFYTIIVFLTSCTTHEEYRDYWYDDVRYDESLPYEKQLKKHVFAETDKINIIINDTPTENIPVIDNLASVKVTVKLDIAHVNKVEITDVLLESVSGYAKEGTIFPTNMALYKLDPTANVSEITTSFRNISVLHLKGFHYSEMVLMVKVRTADGKNFYTVKRIKVHV